MLFIVPACNVVSLLIKIALFLAAKIKYHIREHVAKIDWHVHQHNCLTKNHKSNTDGLVWQAWFVLIMFGFFSQDVLLWDFMAKHVHSVVLWIVKYATWQRGNALAAVLQVLKVLVVKSLLGVRSLWFFYCCISFKFYFEWT